MKWPTAKFSELFRVKHGYAFKSQFFDTSGSYVLLTPGSFHEEGGYREQGEKTKFYTGDVPDGFTLDEGDLLVAMTEQAPGLLGSSAWIPESNRFLHNQRLGRIVDVDEHRLDRRFLYYLFNARGVRHQISGSASGTKVRHTAPERIGRVEVNLPPIQAQRTIAKTLTAYDELMENNRRRMELLGESARLLYREWFIRFCFPGHEHAKITRGLPQGWAQRCLGEIAEVNRATLSKCYDGEIEYVDISSVLPGHITETTTYDFREAPSRARRIVRHGDIIWSCVRPNRRSHAVIWNPPDNLIVSTGFAVITPAGAPSTFIYLATTTDSFVGHLENHARGAAYPAVVAADFERAKILVPPKKLLESFAEIVEPTFSQIYNLRQQNQKLHVARDLLLPRLMTGEIVV
ncbi:MAG: restriction endonuclease subunit S [Verrucomicrobiota bacterium]|jgi:type I restriction enzyme S subunit